MSGDQPSAEVRRGLECFARNGRWGTCSECPRDSDGRVLPELCQHTGRGDHHLQLHALADMHCNHAARAAEARAQQGLCLGWLKP